MISTTVDNVEVTGFITQRTPADLEVEINYPFHHVAVKTRVPQSAQSHSSFEEPGGDEWAELLLVHVYGLCAYTWRNMHRLSGEYEKLKRNLIALYRQDLEDSELGYRAYFMKLHFFQTNYPDMYVSECSWDGLLALIEELGERQGLTA